MEEQAQRLIDQTTAAFKSGKIAPGAMGGFARFGMPPPGMSMNKNLYSKSFYFDFDLIFNRVCFFIFSGHATNGYDEAAYARNATWYASNGYEATYAWYAATAWYVLNF